MEAKPNVNDCSKNTQKQIQDSLRAFFADINNYGHIILSADRSISGLTKNLDDIADRLVAIDIKIDDIRKETRDILYEEHIGKLPEDISRIFLGDNHSATTKLKQDRSELQLLESTFCRNISKIEDFKASEIWWHLESQKNDVQSDTGSVFPAYIDRIEIYVK
jgi:hypothetical protein